MSKQEFINYGTFLEFASLLNPENYPENYSGSGHRKSPKTLVKMIKMFDLYIYRFNHRIGLYGADNYIDAELSISPYDFCSDPKISKKNLGFDLQEYTESLITKIKDEEYIPTVPELEPYKVFINHKVFNDSLDNEIDLINNEKATYFFSNKKIIDTSGNLINKGYHFTVDCINKFIRLFTSNNDEEYTTYELKINTKEGVLTITDGKSNFINLFSQEDNLVITTNKRVEVNTVECEVNATETATVNTKLCTINATDKAEVNTKVSIINAEDSAEVNTKNSTVNASDVSNINTKEANIKAENQCIVEATMANIKAKNECNIETAMAKIKANANCSIESAQISLKGNISVN